MGRAGQTPGHVPDLSGSEGVRSLRFSPFCGQVCPLLTSVLGDWVRSPGRPGKDPPSVARPLQASAPAPVRWGFNETCLRAARGHAGGARSREPSGSPAPAGGAAPCWLAGSIAPTRGSLWAADSEVHPRSVGARVCLDAAPSPRATRSKTDACVWEAEWGLGQRGFSP